MPSTRGQYNAITGSGPAIIMPVTVDEIIAVPQRLFAHNCWKAVGAA
jgi:hypothetical protein